MNIKQTNVVQISTFILVISPILNVYKLGTMPISLAEIAYIFLIAFFLFVLFSNQSIKITKPAKCYSLFLIVNFIIAIIMGTFLINTITTDFFIKWAQMLLYSLPIIFFSSNFFNSDFGSKAYVSISFFLSLFLVIQFISYQAFHIQIKGLLPNIPLNYNLSSSVEYYNYLNYHNIYRPSSIFIEPAHFAQYVSLGLLLELFSLKNSSRKKHLSYYRALIITMALIFSGSAIGFFSVLFFWGYWFWKYFVSKGRFIKSYFISIFFISIGGISLVKTTFFDKFLYRISTIGDLTSSTGSLRILRGFYIYSLGGPVNKIFGIGLGNVIIYLLKNSITTPYDSNIAIGNEYMNSISYILLTSGFFGFVIFLVFLCQCFIYTDSNGKLILVYLVILLSTSAILLSPIYVIILVFVISKPKSSKILQV